MNDSLGHDKPLSRVEGYSASFEVNQQLALKHIKELIVRIVFVPVILALYNPLTDRGLIHLAQRQSLLGAGNRYSIESRMEKIVCRS